MESSTENYGSRIILASGDFRAERASEKGRKSAESKTPAATSAPAPDHEIVSSPSGQELLADVTWLAAASVRFAEAGASWIVAPTDGLGLDSEQASERSREDWIGVQNVAVRSIKAAVSNHAVKVVGAIGPTDALITLSESDESTLHDDYSAWCRALCDGGCDVILCRSFSELEQLVVAVKAAVSTGLPVVASMTFDSGPDFTETILGVTIPQMCRAMAESGATLIGCDGSEYPDGAPAIVTLLRQSCPLPVYIERSAGRAELGDDGLVYPESPREFADRMEALKAAGAAIIGGGRGVTVAHIVEAARQLDRLSKRRGPVV